MPHSGTSRTILSRLRFALDWNTAPETFVSSLAMGERSKFPFGIPTLGRIPPRMILFLEGPVYVSLVWPKQGMPRLSGPLSGFTAARGRLPHTIVRWWFCCASAMSWRGVACEALCSLDIFQAVFGNLTGEDARPWSLAIYSFVFLDSAPKARDQNSLVHRIIGKRATVGFKRVWMRGVSEEHIRCDT